MANREPIKEQYYTEKEGRDPEKYLGIDSSTIPWSKFKGIFSDNDDIIFTDDHYAGVQFAATRDGKGVVIATTNPDQYVTREDLENDYWLIIGHAMMEISPGWSTQIKDTPYSKSVTRLQERYQNGDSGLLEYSNQDFNKKGEYMWTKNSFDTRPYPEESIQGTLMRHIEFAHWEGGIYMMHERNTTVRTNSENIKALKEIMVRPQFEMMKANGMLPESIEQDFDKCNFNQVHFPPFGAMEFVEDNLVETFIVTKK